VWYCHCEPRIQQEENGKVVIHNAYDGREFYEHAEAGDIQINANSSVDFTLKGGH